MFMAFERLLQVRGAGWYSPAGIYQRPTLPVNPAVSELVKPQTLPAFPGKFTGDSTVTLF